MASLAVTPGLVFQAAANIVPLAGLAFFGWRAAAVIDLYFIEAFVVYVVTGRMLYVVQEEKDLDVCTTFIIRYGLGLALMAGIWAGMLADALPELMRQFADPWVQIAAVGFVVAHLFSYLSDFVGKREYERLSAEAIQRRMASIFLPLFVLPFMMGEVMFAGSFTAAVMLVVVKTFISLRAYAKEQALAAEPT